jgi:hypothetical protein
MGDLGLVLEDCPFMESPFAAKKSYIEMVKLF